MPKSVSHEDATIQSFRNDVNYAIQYLKAVLEYGDTAEIKKAVRRVAEAWQENKGNDEAKE